MFPGKIFVCKSKRSLQTTALARMGSWLKKSCPFWELSRPYLPKQNQLLSAMPGYTQLTSPKRLRKEKTSNHRHFAFLAY